MNIIQWHRRKKGIIEYINGLVAYYIPVLGLEDWTIMVSVDRNMKMEGGSGVLLGQCDADHNYKTAAIRFNAFGLDLPHVNPEEVVVHELLHCKFQRMADFVGNRLKGHARAEFYGLIEELIVEITPLITSAAHDA